MNKQEKNKKVEELTALLNENKNFYLGRYFYHNRY